MIVEHITALTGHSTDRDTNTIYHEVKQALKALSTLPLGRHELPLPSSQLTIRVTIASEGAIFDLYKEKPEHIMYTTVCCFAKQTQGLMYPVVVSMSNTLPFLKQQSLPRPKREHWLYTLPVAPFVGSPEDNMMAGDAEFPIWYALYQNPNITVDRVTESKAGKATASTPTPVDTHLIQVGEPFPLPEHYEVPNAEVARILRNNLSFDVLCYSLQPEIDHKMFTKDPLQYGVYQAQHVPFFLLKFTNVQFDASINVHRFENEVVEDWLNSKANLVTLYLIHARTNVVYGIRAIGLRPVVVEQIRDICEKQDEYYTDKKQVDKAIDTIMATTTTEQMIARATMYRI